MHIKGTNALTHKILAQMYTTINIYRDQHTYQFVLLCTRNLYELLLLSAERSCRKNVIISKCLTALCILTIEHDWKYKIISRSKFTKCC